MKEQSATNKASRPRWSNAERNIVLIIIGITAIILMIFGYRIVSNNLIRNIEIEGVEAFTVISAQHVETRVNYPQSPPVGGPHNAVWQNCGVYFEPIPNETAVHSMEHGAIWITYQPDLPREQVAQLARITQDSTHRLLSPYPGLDSPIVLSAWGYQLRLEEVDDPRLMQFILKYEQGPTTPEPGAVCSGGTSVTLSQLNG